MHLTITRNVIILNLYIPGSNMSYTGTEASKLERPILQGVEQGMYLRSLLPGSHPQGMSRYPHHNLADGQLGLGTEVMRRSRKNDQRGRRIKWTHAPRRHVRERHRLDTVHGNGRSALPKRGKGTTDHDTWRARRRRWRYKRR